MSAARPLVGGDFPLTSGNFHQLARLLHAQSGIHLAESKASLVHSRLVKRLRELRLESFDQYCALVVAEAGAEERVALLTALTTNVTAFFREPHHFDHLRERVARVLAPKVKSGARVRLWSSSCSTGEEAYSMALTLLSALPDAICHDVRILASDIDPLVVKRAREGNFCDADVEPIAAPLRDRYFTQVRKDVWRAGEALRSLVSFRELNLIGAWPMKGKFDIVFCRNTVIYFDEPTQHRVWLRFRDILHPDGRLYVGHSERVDAPGFASDGLTIYRLAGAR